MGAVTDLEGLARAVRNPGRFVLGPTSVTGAFPYGGVSLGFATDIEVEWDIHYYENRDPASGAVSEVARRSVEVARIAAILDGPYWDEDALVAAFTKTTPFSSLTVSSPPETRIEGASIPAVVSAWPGLLFAAADSSGKSVYFSRPVLKLTPRTTAFALAHKAGMPLVFVPTLPANNVLPFQIARLENISL